MIVGTLNVIYGIGALDNASWWVGDTRLVLSDLSAVGWILIILGIIQVTGGFSLMAGNAYGRVIGIIGAGIGAFWALLSIDERPLVLVAGDLRPLHLRARRDHRVRRGREGRPGGLAQTEGRAPFERVERQSTTGSPPLSAA